MKVVSLQTRRPGTCDEVEFQVRGTTADTPFGHLWISTEAVSWLSEDTGTYAVRSWTSFARMMAESERSRE